MNIPYNNKYINAQLLHPVFSDCLTLWVGQVYFLVALTCLRFDLQLRSNKCRTMNLKRHVYYKTD
jgi:hypothetical protein